jgi:hypothetical protein
MAHDTLKNKSIKIPDLHFRNPHAWYPYSPGTASFQQDPLVEEAEREQWGEDVSDPNYFATALDEEEVHYGAKLESLAESLDKEVDDNEHEEQSTESSDDEHDHEEIEGSDDRK